MAFIFENRDFDSIFSDASEFQELLVIEVKEDDGLTPAQLKAKEKKEKELERQKEKELRKEKREKEKEAKKGKQTKKQHDKSGKEVQPKQVIKKKETENKIVKESEQKDDIKKEIKLQKEIEKTQAEIKKEVELKEQLEKAAEIRKDIEHDIEEEKMVGIFQKIKHAEEVKKAEEEIGTSIEISVKKYETPDEISSPNMCEEFQRLKLIEQNLIVLKETLDKNKSKIENALLPDDEANKESKSVSFVNKSSSNACVITPCKTIEIIKPKSKESSLIATLKDLEDIFHEKDIIETILEQRSMDYQNEERRTLQNKISVMESEKVKLEELLSEKLSATKDTDFDLQRIKKKCNKLQKDNKILEKRIVSMMQSNFQRMEDLQDSLRYLAKQETDVVYTYKELKSKLPEIEKMQSDYACIIKSAESKPKEIKQCKIAKLNEKLSPLLLKKEQLENDVQRAKREQIELTDRLQHKKRMHILERSELDSELKKLQATRRHLQDLKYDLKKKAQNAKDKVRENMQAEVNEIKRLELELHELNEEYQQLCEEKKHLLKINDSIKMKSMKANEENSKEIQELFISNQK